MKVIKDLEAFTWCVLYEKHENMGFYHVNRELVALQNTKYQIM